MDKGEITLYELNNIVRNTLEGELSGMYWILAETSDVRANANGHCYLELIQKDNANKNIIAKARAMIWANSFGLLKAYFEETTGQPFASNLKVFVQVSVHFHELYGFSLNIHDIDPSYTLGEQAKLKAQIIAQLKEDGIFDLNKELELPSPLQRIAVISSASAAGYEDFCNQLSNNAHNFKFYARLFPSVMQGERAEESILNALEKIAELEDHFDAAVIIRGGGATSDLSCFDSYILASAVAQFPLPVITGIGHERDESILDMVAHMRAKTPTAVAEFLISSMLDEYSFIQAIAENIIKATTNKISAEKTYLASTDKLLNAYSQNIIQLEYRKLENYHRANLRSLENHNQQQNANLLWIAEALKKASKAALIGRKEKLSYLSEKIIRAYHKNIDAEKIKLNFTEKQLELSSPINLLTKGYTYTLLEGKLVKSKNILEPGDEITTVFHDGDVESIVK